MYYFLGKTTGGNSGAVEVTRKVCEMGRKQIVAANGCSNQFSAAFSFVRDCR